MALTVSSLPGTGIFFATGTPTGTIGGAWNTIIFGTETSDRLNAYNNATGIFTALYTGWYSASACYLNTGTGVGGSDYEAIRLLYNNTTTIASNLTQVATGVTLGRSHNCEVAAYLMTAGDTLRAQSYNGATSAAYANINGNDNHFAVSFIGPS